MKKRHLRRRLQIVEQKPVRQIVSRSGKTPRGDFPSHKNDRMVGYEHLLERDACVLFEMSPLVVSYREQPERLWFSHGDRTRSYTPDYELELADGQRVLVEVKPAHRLATPDVREKFDHIVAHMTRANKHFVILTDIEIRKQPRLSNLRRLLHDAPLFDVTADVLRRSIRALVNSQVSTFGDAESAVGREIFINLLMRGAATCPLDQAITSDTAITLTLEDTHAWFFIKERSGF